jgi:hypothetical protein
MIELPLVGGRLHRSVRQIEDDATRWVDLQSGDTYYRNDRKYIERTPGTGAVVGAWECDILIHEDLIPAAGDPPAVRVAKVQGGERAWEDLITHYWMTQCGTQKPLSEVPRPPLAGGLRPSDGASSRTPDGSAPL